MVNNDKIFHDTGGSKNYRYCGTYVRPDFLGHRPVPDGEKIGINEEKFLDRTLVLATRPGEFKKKNRAEGSGKPKKAKTVATCSLATVEEGKPLKSDNAETFFTSPPISGSVGNLFKTVQPTPSLATSHVPQPLPATLPGTSSTKMRRKSTR